MRVTQYTYGYSLALRSTALFLLTVFTGRTVLNGFVFADLSETVIFGLALGAVFYLINYGRTLNVSVTVAEDGLRIHRHIGGDRYLPYTRITRLLVQRMKHVLGGSRLYLTIFTPDGNQAIELAGLVDYADLLRELEQRTAAGKTPALYQDDDGELLPSLRELELRRR